LLVLVIGIVSPCAAPEALAVTPAVKACLDASEEGQDLRTQGKLRAALERFATCAASTCPAAVRKPCARWQDEVVAAMPSIIVAVRDETEADVADATVRVDDAPAEAVSGRAWTVDPGAHTIVAEAPHHRRVEQKLVVSMAETNRIVRLRLANTSPAEATPPTPSAEVAPLPSPSKRDSSIPVAPIALAGVSVASATLSVVMGLGARGDANQLRDAPCGTTHSCPEGQLDGIHTRLVVADVALGVAVASAAVAVWLWLSERSARRSATAAWRGLTF
jgi:hypothetical protein